MSDHHADSAVVTRAPQVESLMAVAAPESLAAALSALPDYRVMRRLPLRTAFREPDGRPLVKVMVVDVETTGLDVAEDEIIEFGALLVEADAVTGEAFRILDTYSGLEEVSRPLDPENIVVHGITDEMLEGQRLDDDRIEAMRAAASLVVAHKADFDRKMIERRFPAFEQSAWACSVTEVGWRDEGVACAVLDFLLTQAGYFHDSHRALTDCRALVEVLQQPLPLTGDLPLARLFQRSTQPHFRIWALGLPFDNTQRVKKKLHYRWEPDLKLWYGDTDAAGLAQARAQLREIGYDNREGVQVRIELIPAQNKFTARGGRSALRVL